MATVATTTNVSLTTKSSDKGKLGSASRLLTVVFLVGLAMFLAWRELRVELDASVKDFASSLEHRHELSAD